VLTLITAPVQWVVYAIVIRSAFGLSGGRAVLVALFRVLAGAAVYTLLERVVHFSAFTLHIMSAPIAWAVVAPSDPRLTWRRLLLWVAVGTVATAGLDYVLFKTLMGDDYLQTSLGGRPNPR